MGRLWTKSFILVTLSMFFLFTSFYMLYPTLPLYIIEIGGNEAHAGLAMGIFMISAVLCRPFVGALIDRYGRKSFLIGGILLFAITMFSYELATGIVVLILLRFIHGITWGISTTSVMTTVTDLIPIKRRGEGLGWSGMAMTLAMAIGPMIGVWIVDDLSFQLLFIIGAFLAICSLVLSLCAKVPFIASSSQESRQLVFFEKSVLPLAVTTFLVFISYGGITTFIPLYASTIDFNSGTFFLIYAFTLIIIRPLAGKLADRFSEITVIAPSLCITILALIILANVPNSTGIIIASILYGIGFGSVQPALQAATIKLVAPERIGIANASFSTATDLGIGLGAMVLGVISQFTSFQSLFNISAASVLFSLIIFFINLKKVIKK
ncbi:MFS transporter [Bacillus safensis]|uniref:MFS transporter n=1 Tax=Bacillus safensis TaxID=561879 RepID=UPI000469CDA3|nr:MFS transporter [Bacillus safensis]